MSASPTLNHRDTLQSLGRPPLWRASGIQMGSPDDGLDPLGFPLVVQADARFRKVPTNAMRYDSTHSWPTESHMAPRPSKHRAPPEGFGVFDGGFGPLY